MTGALGLYLHVPFCQKKCLYCDFPSWAGLENRMEPVVRRMEKDLKEAGERLSGREIGTAYIGGGTPSLLPPALMERLLRAARAAFPFQKGAECTCEMNPGTVTDAFLDTLTQNGVNRVSMGVQSANDALLKALGRIHTFQAARDSAAKVKKHGILNLNLDMMIGLPGQTLGDVSDTLDAFLSLEPTHVSCYGLILEEGTPFRQMADAGTLPLPGEEMERDMYEYARETLEKRGFKQYEISNFARPGYACRHNADCWSRAEYLGVGCAACGFIGQTRYRNPSTIPGYLSGDVPEYTVLSDADARFETLMLGLRMTRGVSLSAFEQMHGVPLLKAYGEKLQKPIREGLVLLEDGFLRLTRRGMDVQNAVLVDLME